MLVTHPEQMPDAFDRALSQRDLPGLRELLDENTVQRSLDGQIVSGEELLASLQALIGANADLHGKPRFSVISGDVALIVADFHMDIDAPTGERQHVDGTVTNVLRRHSDGGWRFAILNPRGVE